MILMRTAAKWWWSWWNVLRMFTADVDGKHYQLCPFICRPQIKLFIEGLFSFDQDFNAFKEHLRDFLVQIRVRHRLCVHGLLRGEMLKTRELLLLQNLLFTTLWSDQFLWYFFIWVFSSFFFGVGDERTVCFGVWFVWGFPPGNCHCCSLGTQQIQEWKKLELSAPSRHKIKNLFQMLTQLETLHCRQSVPHLYTYFLCGCAGVCRGRHEWPFPGGARDSHSSGSRWKAQGADGSARNFGTPWNPWRDAGLTEDISLGCAGVSWLWISCVVRAWWKMCRADAAHLLWLSK